MCLVERGSDDLVGRSPVLEGHDVGAQREDATRPLARLVRGLQHVQLPVRRLQAVEIRELLEMHGRIPRPRGEDATLDDAFVHEHAGFAVVADADERRHAGIQHGLALVRIEIELRIPEPGNDELAVGLENLGAGGRRRAFAADRRDAIAANDDLDIADGRAAVAVDQGAALDDDRLRRCRRRLSQQGGDEHRRYGKCAHDHRSRVS